MKSNNENSYSTANGTSTNKKSTDEHPTSMIIVILTFLTLSSGLFYIIENGIYHDGVFACLSKLSLLRLISAVLVPAYLAVSGLKKQSLDISGAVLGVIVAFVLTITRWSFLWALMAFFVTSSKATKYKQEIKKKIEGDDFKPGGQRNWVQVICNGGPALFMAVQYLHSVGLEKVKNIYSQWLKNTMSTQ